MDGAADRPRDAIRSPSPRLLIIRFSSFGDIVQALAAPAAFRRAFPHAKVDWLVREDFRGLIEPHPLVSRTIVFERKAGLLGLISLAWRLSGDGYTHVYDAHNNLRSSFVMMTFRTRRWLRFFRGPRLLRRPKDRIKRFLFFKLGLPTIPQPFRGSESFLLPFRRWNIDPAMPEAPQFYTNASLPGEVSTSISSLSSPRIALAPSAAWEMKRWPIAHWKTLIALWKEARFVLMGGPGDQFLEEIRAVAPERVINTAGRLSLAQSASLLKECDLLIANDTGMLHVADQMGRPTLALIGPTAFGYPSHRNSVTVEVDSRALSCKPCSKDGRGKCVNSVYQRCLVEITPETVLDTALALLNKKDL